jgi:hypothetical protein
MTAGRDLKAVVHGAVGEPCRRISRMITSFIIREISG